MKGDDPVVACVLGDMDLIHALALGHIPTAAVVTADDPARFSRFTTVAMEALDPWTESQRFAEELVRWGQSKSSKPILFYQTDGDLFLVSRHRSALSEAFRFVVPDAALVEDLADKARFQRLAEELGLRVPRGCHLTPATGPDSAMRLRFPIVVKPRWQAWRPSAGGCGSGKAAARNLPQVSVGAKAIRVESTRQMCELWPRIAHTNLEVMAQELVPGPETLIESYHAYIDEDGSIAGEFTGMKLRTDPPEFGDTTALAIGRRPDVIREGRTLVARLALRGVVKVDYKRDPEGRLFLLEANPRFNLWHYAGAVAGVNLPALVYADLTGQPRPAVNGVRSGVTWCHPWEDRYAARAVGMSRTAWLAWTVRCRARHAVTWDDPMPLLRGIVLPKSRERFASRRGGWLRTSGMNKGQEADALRRSL
jgi:predicted ATP-grasp superfamily ATP-dependent carboligase